jgi:Ca2+-binding RTX toxin-like protein
MAVIWGTKNSETLDALDGVTNGNDIVLGLDGEDTIYGRGGDDLLKGGGGADHFYGGYGVDEVFYDDSPVGVYINLIVPGAAYYGTAQGDTFSNIENLSGSAHDDTLFGNDEVNRISGREGADFLSGYRGNDTLDGGPGDDQLWGDRDADRLIGGDGIDEAAYGNSLEHVEVSLMHNTAYFGDAAGDTFDSIEDLQGSQFDDQLWGNDVPNMLWGGQGDDTLKGYGGADYLYGAEDDDHLLGMDGVDNLNGGVGDDTLDGGANDDILFGYVGSDTMIGGLGNDTYYVQDAGDSVVEYGGQGIDVVEARVSWTLTAGADIETLQTGHEVGTAAIDLIGNSSGNVVRGNAGNNVIGGGDGNDELVGLGGQDQFLFNTALNASTNVDELSDFSVADDTILLDDAIFSSSLGLGNISAGELVIGSAAQDANDRIIYNDMTGALLYDSDGNGAALAIQFAQLPSGLAPTYLDFLVI